MTTGQFLQFIILFGFLLLFNLQACRGVISPECMMTKGRSRSSVRRISILLLIAGLIFLGAVFYALATGTFHWQGDPRAYGFSDFLR